MTDSIDTYIAAFPSEVQTILKQKRTTIRLAAPNAEETPAFKETKI